MLLIRKLGRKQNWFLATLCLVMGCAGKPDRVVTIKSPSNSVFYTKETTAGTGPVSADYTRVYARISNNGRNAKQLVISGEYIENASITWTSPNDVEICIEQGITDTFRNEVTLITGDTPSSSITIHNHLKERC